MNEHMRGANGWFRDGTAGPTRWFRYEDGVQVEGPVYQDETPAQGLTELGRREDEPDHYHCPGPRCYWRIQFTTTCSRCGGATVKQADCCGAGRGDR